MTDPEVPPSVLGAILAGGRAQRFGSDKAEASLNGQTLLSHVIAALEAQTACVVLCGREWAPGIALPDRPDRDLGPLGGLNAALHYAQHNGFDAVVTAGCDTPLLPTNLVAQLGAQPGAAIVSDIPIIGYWPVALANRLDAHLAAGGNRSVMRWADVVGARLIALDSVIPNINTPDDLDRVIRSRDAGQS